MKFDFDISITDSVILSCIKSKAVSMLWYEIPARDDFYMLFFLNQPACLMLKKFKL